MEDEPNLDPVWEGTLEKIIRRAMFVARPGYRLWTAISVVLYAALLILPGASAIQGITGHASVQEMGIYSVGMLVVVGFILMLNPQGRAAGYEAAVQNIWAARVAYNKNPDIAAGDKEARIFLLKAIGLIMPDAHVVILRDPKSTTLE